MLTLKKRIVRLLQKGELDAIKHQKNYFLVCGFDDWLIICKTYLIFKICGKIDLLVKINCLVCKNAMATGDSTNSFPTWHLRNWRKFSTNRRVSTQIRVVKSQQYWISALIPQELFSQGNHWWVVKCWLISWDVLYNSQLVSERLRSLLLL